MSDTRLNGICSTSLWIDIGAAAFLVALIVSAVVVPELRLLHFFQALIYIAVMILAHRNSSWGYGAGFAIGIAWNALNLFITHLMLVGAVAFWDSLRHGHVEQLVPMMVTLGGIGHFILIVATLSAAISHNAEPKRWWKFVGGGAVAVAYFILIISFTHPH